MSAQIEQGLRVRRVSDTVIQVELPPGSEALLAAAGPDGELPVEYLHALLEMHLQAVAGATTTATARGVQAVW